MYILEEGPTLGDASENEHTLMLLQHDLAIPVHIWVPAYTLESVWEHFGSHLGPFCQLLAPF